MLWVFNLDSSLGNEIGDDGSEFVASVLIANKTLTTLDLCGNEIGDKGAKIIAQAVSYNRSLKRLRIKGFHD